MKLTYKQIKDITIGAAYIEESDGKIIFHRFTKAEEELYRSTEYKYFKKTFANSCIALEFETDSASLFIKSHVTPRSSRLFYSHDVFVDNVFCGALKGMLENDADIEKGVIVEGSFALGTKKETKRVRLCLPWSCSSDIIELSIDDGSTLCPIKKSRKMLIYGDSITQGYDAEYTSNSYASRLTNVLDAEPRNKGIGGEIFRPELAEIKNEDFAPDIITVAYGTNDWSEGITKDALEIKIYGFFGALSRNYPSAKIFAIAPIWRADYKDYRAFGDFLEIKECFFRVTEKYSNITVINGFDFVPHDSSLFSDKYLHPNDEGFSYYASRLTDEIKKYI